MRMLITIVFLTVLTAISVSCSEQRKPVAPDSASATVADPAPAPPIPSVEEAKSIVAGSAEFSDFQSPYSAWSLPTRGELLKGGAKAMADDLESDGWIRRDASGNVVLTEKARADKRFLERPNGFVDIVPLAKKEITAVTNVRPTDADRVLVEFDWRWIPNEIGSAFGSGAVKERFETPQSGVATLQPAAEGGWEVLIIEPRSAN